MGATRKMAELAAVGAYNVTLDSPLLIRLLEFAREEALDDASLHRLAERVAAHGANRLLDMSDYDALVGGLSTRSTVPASAPPAPADVAELAPVPAVASAKKRAFVVRAEVEGRAVTVDRVEAADQASALEKARERYGKKVTVAPAAQRPKQIQGE